MNFEFKRMFLNKNDYFCGIKAYLNEKQSELRNISSQNKSKKITGFLCCNMNLKEVFDKYAVFQ